MSEKNNVSINGGGLGMTLLTALFVWLKVEGKIDWSWWLVFLPMWGGIALVFAFLIIVGIIAAIVRD